MTSIAQPMTDENGMLNMMKTKMMFDLVATLGVGGDDSGLAGMFVKFLALMLVPIIIKMITDVLGKMKQWLSTNCTISIGMITDPEYNFKYEIILNDNTYNALVLSQIFNTENSKYRTRLTTSVSSFSSQFFTEKKPIGVMEFLAQFGSYIVPIKTLGFGQYMYASRNTGNKFKITCNTKMQDLIDYLDDLNNKYKKMHENVKRKISIHTGGDELPTFLETPIEMENVFCEKKEQLLQVIKHFQDVQWYNDRGLTRHLTILFKGEHGCGKTKMITAIAHMLQKNLVMVDCATQLKTKKQLKDLFDHHASNSIICLEDFDRVTSALIKNDFVEEKTSTSSTSITNTNSKEHLGRLFDAYANCPAGKANEEKRKELLDLYNAELKLKENCEELDLSFLLNEIDGPKSRPGRIIFLTANHPERIEPALRRPGRIDYEVEFPKASREIVAKILCRFFKDTLVVKDILSKLQQETKDEEKLNQITETTNLFDTVKDYKFSHSQIYAVCKKYNDLNKVVAELSSDNIDLSSVHL
jgi:hypothetical protein